MKRILAITAIITALFFVALFTAKKAVVHYFDDSVKIPSVSQAVCDIELKKGDFIFFGEYKARPILWQVTDIKGGKPLLTSHFIICQKAFDASSERFILGSSDWDSSTLKKWLNSSDGKVKYTVAPNKDNVFNSWNSYDTEPGFLSKGNFTSEQIKMIADDGVFILSKNEISQYYNSAQRKKSLSTAAAKSDNSSYIALPGMSVWYWVNTPVSANDMCVSAVTTTGSFYKSPAYDSTVGVVPSIYLKTQNVKAFGDGSFEYPYYCR